MAFNATIAAACLMAFGVIVLIAAVLPVVDIPTILGAREIEPDAEALRGSALWAWGWRLPVLRVLGLLAGVPTTLGLWWLDLEGGPYELSLKAEARRDTKSDVPHVVLARMLHLEATRAGRRPEHVLQYATCLPTEAADKPFMDALRVEMLEVRDLAIDSLRDSDGSIPEVEYAGRAYDPGELRSLAERAGDAIWECTMPRGGTSGTRA